MSSYTIVQGDLEPPMPVALFANGLPFAVPGTSTVQLRWRKPGGAVAVVSLTEVNGALGQYTRTWIPGDTDLAGAHEGQVLVTAIDGRVRTWPSGVIPISWTVSPKLA